MAGQAIAIDDLSRAHVQQAIYVPKTGVQLSLPMNHALSAFANTDYKLIESIYIDGASSGVQSAGCGVNRRATSLAVAYSYGQNLVSKPLRLRLKDAKQRYTAAKNAAWKAVKWDKRLCWQERAVTVQLELLFSKSDLHAAYKEVRLRADAAGMHKKMPDNMGSADGDIVLGRQQNAELKRQYFATLMNVNRQTAPDLSALNGVASPVDVNDHVPSQRRLRSRRCK
ncbi:hypothetical protein MMC07_006823 [Pseudocyphellaria aurata]|nr:hypothetical protein [Pseudocyphellaria aurata]